MIWGGSTIYYSRYMVHDKIEIVTKQVSRQNKNKLAQDSPRSPHMVLFGVAVVVISN